MVEFKIKIGGANKNLYMLVNEEDYYYLRGIRCYFTGRYVVSTINSKTVYVHRLVAHRMGLLSGRFSHKNGNVFDNRRCNILRTDRSTAHLLSKKINKRNTTRIRGVDQIGNLGKWRARITISGKQYHLGIFDRKEDAARCRKEYEDMYLKSAILKLNRHGINY